VGVLGSFFVGWTLVGLCLWFRYPVSGLGADCAIAEAMNLTKKLPRTPTHSPHDTRHAP